MNFPAKKVMQRYAFVASILMILGIAILGKALYIMTVQKSYWMAVSERFVKENQEVLPTRGNILAADGQVLAASLPEYKLFMDFMSWEKDSLRRAKDQHRRDSLLTHKIDSIAQGTITVRQVDEFGRLDGVAYIREDDITFARCMSEEEEKLSRLHCINEEK